MTPADELVIRLACEKGLLLEEQLAVARAEIASRSASEGNAAGLLNVLVKQGAWDPVRSTALLAAEFGMETVDLDARSVEPEVLALISRADAARHRLFVFDRKGGAISVA